MLTRSRISLSKKELSINSMKEVFKQNQFITETLKIIISRSEDIAALKSISERKSGKLKLQSSICEKTLQEVESKEEWRLTKEEFAATQLINAKLEAPLHKAEFIKLSKKMLKINTQYDDDPTETDMSLPDIHVQKIMNLKIGPENTIITSNEKGHQLVTVPSASVPIFSWKESYSQRVKTLDALLSSEVLQVYPVIFFCIKHSRHNLKVELSRQRHAIDEAANSLMLGLSISSKKSKSTLPAMKLPLSPVKRISGLPEPDYKRLVMKVFLDLNVDIEKSIKAFAKARSPQEKPRGKNKDLLEKTLRLRGYEKVSAVNPWASIRTKMPLDTVRTINKLKLMPQILFGLENSYFEDSRSLASRIKVIHSCIVIQNYYREKRNRILIQKVMVVQKIFRGFLGKQQVLAKKTVKLRTMYLWMRLQHWYPLLVNKFRERKSSRYFDDQYFIERLEYVIRIQRVIQGFLARKIIVKWKRTCFTLRKRREYRNFYLKKQRLWNVAEPTESLIFEQYKFTEKNDSLIASPNETLSSRPTSSQSQIKPSEYNIITELQTQIKTSRLKLLEYFSAT